ncbi:membrane associated rhomboid family serine protease [Saccharothrix tamanrassetensis]|uniref:Membrane associated rhomboid family serine protease n=1 Tax=Saccharothrix tamanrassetensis TaxID=1051531 RepID=A0A841CMA4_9PSEU|nr:rhomboid family intramembrane serine protease [Saccharothrix tamanrassetensis]MBB5958721.1 membrane associated rhomboid family serine protease [Saccharothrix tamanrassetensis]
MNQPVVPGDPVGAPACVRHPDRVTGLRCTRCERPACPECLREASVGYQCVDCVSEGRRTVRPARTFVGAELSSRLIVTPVLIALNVLLFAVTAVQAGSVMGNQNSPFFAEFFLWPAGVYYGEWWRLFTSGFLHFGPAHLALNMIALYVLGRDLEPVFGKVRFLAVYLVSLLGGGVAVYLFGAVNTPVAGASGAVYGLMGAMLVAVLRLKLNPGSALGVIGLNLVLSFTLPGISLLGHLGGLVVGAAVTAGLVYAPPARRNAWQAGAVAAAFALLVVMAFVRTGQLG